MLGCLFLIYGINASAQSFWSHLGKNIHYRLEGQTTMSDEHTPLWLNANRYGLSSVKGNNGYLRASIHRPVQTDSTRHWKIGYGIDLAAAYNFTSTTVLQQLYADIQYKKLRFSIGSKERPANLKNAELSSGSQTLGINARPIPEVRLEIPEYISITGKSNWAAIRGHIGYGFMTDGDWQKNFTGKNGKYAEHALYHSKSGFLRIGNESKFPLVLEGGVEMGSTFGGNLHINGTYIDMGHSLKSFWSVFTGSGYDPTDGLYPNAEGNTLGSWLVSLSYRLKDWKFRLYYDHFFEDHSMMFFEYGWKDGMIGIEINMPKNPFVNNLVYEYVTTEYQAGPIYQDATPEIPSQISGKDNYYNHNIYNGWQHWGQAIGNPLFTSPLYYGEHSLYMRNNRFTAHHIGINGNPLPELHYRLLLSLSRNLGTYDRPFTDIRHNTSLLTELFYSPTHIGQWKMKGWSIGAAFAFDRGKLIDNNTGLQITLRKQGCLNL